MNYKLRNCKYSDLDFIFDLKKTTMKWYIEKIYGWNDQIQKNKTKIELDKNINNMKIVLVDDKHIGVTTFTEETSNYVIGLIIIDPKYQGNGIASNIINNYINIAKNNNKRIIIKTYKDNPAKKLYIKLGFKIYDKDETHIYMEII